MARQKRKDLVKSIQKELDRCDVLRDRLKHTPELEKTLVFSSYFLENCKKMLIFTKISNKLGEFLNFLGFSKIFLDFHIFFFTFLKFLEFSRAF